MSGDVIRVMRHMKPIRRRIFRTPARFVNYRAIFRIWRQLFWRWRMRRYKQLFFTNRKGLWEFKYFFNRILSQIKATQAYKLFVCLNMDGSWSNNTNPRICNRIYWNPLEFYYEFSINLYYCTIRFKFLAIEKFLPSAQRTKFLFKFTYFAEPNIQMKT